MSLGHGQPSEVERMLERVIAERDAERLDNAELRAELDRLRREIGGDTPGEFDRLCRALASWVAESGDPAEERDVVLLVLGDSDHGDRQIQYAIAKGRSSLANEERNRRANERRLCGHIIERPREGPKLGSGYLPETIAELTDPIAICGLPLGHDGDHQRDHGPR